MKDTYNNIKQELLTVNESLSSLLTAMIKRPEIADSRFDDWQKSCSDIHNQVTEEIIRVAVIGPVKSGKSTFVNSLFRGDYLKRGAGIITSIVTRLKSGKKLKAVLFFKSWDEVNAEIEQALIMFPVLEHGDENKSFDIRNEKDRQSLQLALDGLSDDLLITDGIRNANAVLLTLYLKGYDGVKEIISADSVTNEFKGKKFAGHRTFVGDDNLAVYLKDVELEIKDDKIDRSIEIADCQGSDSPNPLHLAMIQDYLLKTHYLIYVVSSRTGLRQADIRFLSIIKKMGIQENMLFVVNVDFSEHETLEDLEAVIQKVREEVALIKADPDVYSFSSLFNLFSVSSVKLAKRDNLRLAQWMAEEDMVAFANNESQRFETSLNTKLTRERFGLLLKNHLERMNVMVSGIERWSVMQKDILEKDVDGASEIIKKMEYRQERMKQIKSLIKSTLNGAAADIMKGQRTDIDRFFNVNSEGVSEQTMAFVKQYAISAEKYRDKLEASGFQKTLYVVFQQFKQALDTFMAETINPEIANFSRKIEGRIRTSLESVAGPYHSMAADDMAELKSTVADSNTSSSTIGRNSNSLLDLDAIKQAAGLALPSSATALQYSAKVRTEAFIRLGLYSAVSLVKKVLKKSPEKEKEEQVRALADGFQLIKRETEKSIRFHFENYRENFKFQYVSKLIDAAAEYLHRVLKEKYQSYDSDLTSMEEMMEKKGSDRGDMLDYLEKVSIDAKLIQKSIDKCRNAIDT
jgi:GTPase SAR1 family protein/NADP-dependent 3-hydroxy acid dehydrogenase YdfG